MALGVSPLRHDRAVARRRRHLGPPARPLSNYDGLMKEAQGQSQAEEGLWSQARTKVFRLTRDEDVKCWPSKPNKVDLFCGTQTIFNKRGERSPSLPHWSFWPPHFRAPVGSRNSTQGLAWKTVEEAMALALFCSSHRVREGGPGE